MKKLRFYLAAALGTALMIAGCGGDDGDEATAPATPPPVETTALTKEELIAQGDAVCAEVNAAVGALASTGAGGETGEAAELYSGMVERLKDLGAPSDDSAGHSDFIAAAEGLAQAESDVELAADRGDEEALTTAEAEASSALSTFQEAASDFGFEQCSEDPSAVPAAGAGGAAPGIEAEEPAPEEGEEAAPEEVEEVAPETGGAGSVEEGAPGGGAEAGGDAGGGESGGSSGGIGPG